MGWLRHAPAYDLIVEALHNVAPQFQKSRVAAVIALAHLGDQRAIPHLKQALETNIFELKYASLVALEQLSDIARKGLLVDDPDWLIQAKLAQG